MVEYCDVDICANDKPCPLHTPRKKVYANEIAALKAVWVSDNMPICISPDIGRLILEYYGSDHLGWENACRSKLSHSINCQKYNARFAALDVRTFNTYCDEMRKLIMTLAHHFRIGIVDIIAEYTGARHQESMQRFATGSLRAWFSVHNGIVSFHNDYSPSEMQRWLDRLSGWKDVLIVWREYFNGKYNGAASFTPKIMEEIFDMIIMIALTDPKGKVKNMGCYDFLNYFYKLTLLVLPIEE